MINKLIKRNIHNQKGSLLTCCAATLLCGILQGAPVIHEKDPKAGIWGIWDVETEMIPEDPMYNGDWLRGSMIAVDWNDIQPTKNGGFKWGPLNSKLNAGINNLEQAILIVYHGDGSPHWIYDGNCKKADNKKQDGCVPVVCYRNSNPNIKYPDYVDPDYELYLKPMITAVSNHIKTKSSPGGVRYDEFVTIIQCPIGKSGDPNPYEKNNTHPLTFINGYAQNYLPIGSTAWKNWERMISKHYFNSWKNSGIFMLYKPANHNIFYNEEPFKSNKHQLMMKTAYVTHGYQNNRELNNLAEMENLTSRYLVRGELAEPLKHLIGAPKKFNFDDSDDGNNKYRYWNDRPRQNIYWQCLWMLHFGMDVFNIRDIELFEQGLVAGKKKPVNHRLTYWQDARDTFQFFNERAGIKNAKNNSHLPLDSDKPWKSKYAFIALREGLDYYDTKYVPGPIPAINTNAAKNRFVAIKNKANQLRGSDGHAVMPDPDSANNNKTPLAYLKTLKYQNDVNQKIYTGNYTMFITQKNKDATSQGYWNMGKPESLNGGQKYGKYARGFADGKNNMYFDIHDKFFSSTANTNPGSGYVVDINVTYLDRGNAKFSLIYDGDSGPTTAYTHTMGNTNDWKTRTVTITDAKFGNGAGSNSDIILRRVNGSDKPIFHMIEVVKVDDGVGGTTIDPIGNVTVLEGNTKTRNVTSTGSSLSATGGPGWASFTDNGDGTGSFTFNAPYWAVKHPETQKTWNITVTADGGAASASFVLTVNDKNRDPYFTSPNSDLTMNEGESASITLAASDSDAEDIVNIVYDTATGLPSFGTLSDEGSGSATIDLSPGPNGAGVYTVTIGISDGAGGTASDDIVITVNDVPSSGGEAKFEIEDATFIASSGDPNDGMTNSNASGTGSPNYMHYKATDVGDYIQYEIDIPSAGDYEFYVGIQHGKNCGIVELKVNANGIIGSQDFYQDSWAFGEHLVGTKSFTSGGKRTFTFTVTGKNAASNGYKMRLDYLRISQL